MVQAQKSMMQSHQNRLARFGHGARAFGRGLRFVVSHRALWPLIAAPALLTLLATLAGADAAWTWGHALIAHHLAGHGAFLATLLLIVFVLFVAGVAYLAFLAVSVVATAPFSGAISERVERLATGGAPGPEGFFAQLAEAARELVHTVFALAIYLALAAILFALHFFLPPLAPFTWPASLALTAIFLAYDAFDLPLSRRRASFARKWRCLWDHGAESLGVGVVVALLLAIPGLNLVVPAVAAASGTLLYLELGEPPDSVL